MIFVTVGTQLAFPRLLEMFAAAAPDLVGETFAQTGDPAYAGPLRGAPYLTREDFERRCASARIIVGHAGMGTILAARRLGKPLIVVPRRHALGEHRNDHQMDTAAQLRRLGSVAVAETAEQLAAAIARPPAPLSAQVSKERQRLISTVRDLIAQQDRSAPTIL